MPSLLDAMYGPSSLGAPADKPWYNDAAEVGRQFVGGAVVDLPKMLGQGLRRVAPDGSELDNFGRSVVESAMAREPAWAPDRAGRGPVAETLMMGARGLGPMIPALAATMATGGMAAPAAVAAGTFGLSAAQETEDKLRNQGIPDDQATRAGLLTGAIQGGGEGLATAVGARLLKPMMGGVAPTMEGAVAKATDTALLRPFAKSMGINMLTQPATEVAQDVGTEMVERQFGAKPEDAWNIAKDSAQGAVGMTALLGPLAFLGHRAKSRQAEQIASQLDPLVDPNATPEQRQRALAVAAEVGRAYKVSPRDIGRWMDAQRTPPDPALLQERGAMPRSGVNPGRELALRGNFDMAPMPAGGEMVGGMADATQVPNRPTFAPPPMLGMDPRAGLNSQDQGRPGVINVTSAGTAAPMEQLTGQQPDMFGGQDTFGETGALPPRQEQLNPNAPLQSLAQDDGQTRDMFQETPTTMVGAGDSLLPSAIRSQIMQRLGTKSDGSNARGKNSPDALTVRLGVDLSRVLPNAEQANAHLDRIEEGLNKDLDNLDKKVSGGSNKLTPEEYGAKRDVIENRLLILEAARDVVRESARARTNAYADEAAARGGQGTTHRGGQESQTEGMLRQRNIETQSDEVGQRTHEGRRAAADQERLDILRDVLADKTRGAPIARFRKALTQAGFKNLDITPAEQAEIDRISQRRSDVRAATVVPPGLAMATGRYTRRDTLNAPQAEQETADVRVPDVPVPAVGERSGAGRADDQGSVDAAGRDAAADVRTANPDRPRRVAPVARQAEPERVGTGARAEAPVAAPVRGRVKGSAAAERLATAKDEMRELDQRIEQMHSDGVPMRSRVMQEAMDERTALQRQIDRSETALSGEGMVKAADAGKAVQTVGQVESEQRKLGRDGKGTAARVKALLADLDGIIEDANAPLQHRATAENLKSLLTDKDLNENNADKAQNAAYVEKDLARMRETVWRSGEKAQANEGISQKELESIVAEVAAKTPGSPAVTILDSGTEIGLPDTVLGAVDKSKIHIFRNAIPNRVEALKTIWHELFHVGFGNWLGARPYTQTLLHLAARDGTVRKYAAEWRESAEGVGRRKFMAENDWRARSVEEALARVAEEVKTSGGTKLRPTIRTIVSWAADIADKVGLKGLSTAMRRMTMTDMERFVSDMVMESGKPGGPVDGETRRRGDNATREQNFAKWFGQSKIVNADGTPKTMYHGTSRNITEFKAKQAGAIFVTDSPRFAEGFASASKSWSRSNILELLTPAQRQDALGEAEDRINEEYPNDPDTAEQLIADLYAGSKTELPIGEAGDYFVEAAMKYANAGENIMPLYVRAENPFDYTNMDQAEALTDRLFGGRPSMRIGANVYTRNEFRSQLQYGPWNVIEADEVQELIKEMDHDAFYVSEGGQKNLAVYDANQIKSATGNDGTYSTTNNDIRFRSAGTAEREKALADYPAAIRPIMKRLHRVLSGTGRRALNTMAFTNDLLDGAVKAGLKAAAAYKTLHNEQAKFIGQHERKITDVVNDYNALPSKLKGTGPGTVNDFLQESTRLGKWGYQPDYLKDNDGNAVKVEIDADTADAFKALGKEGQDFVRTVFKIGHETLQEKKRTVLDDVRWEHDMLIAEARKAGDTEKVTELEAEKKKALAQYGSLMRLSGNIPYAPMKRFGKHVVVAESQEYLDADDEGKAKMERDESHRVVDFVETEWEAAKLEDELRAAGYARVDSSMRDENVDATLYGGSKTMQAFQRLREQIEAQYDTDIAKASEDDKAKLKELKAAAVKMRRMVTDMYLQTLAESSARQGEKRRKGTAGHLDMIRSFESQGKADAGFMAALKFGGRQTEILGRMRQEAREGTGTAERMQRSEYFIEVMKRHMQALDYKSMPLADWLARTSSKWYLAFSPAYYIQNATQPWMVSLPIIAGTHGWAKSTAALSKAYGDIGALWSVGDVLKFRRSDFGALLNSKALTPDERTMLNGLIDRQQIDIGMAAEIGSFRIEGKNAIKSGWDKVDNALRHTQNRMEAINRASTALAAYRLEKAAKGDATEYASRIINDTHGDYSAWNAPRAFNTGLGKVALQFRKFQLIQLTLMGKLLKQSLKPGPERAAAMKSLAFIFGQAALVGGTRALPAVAALGWLFSKMFGDTGDEPPEYLIRKMIGDKDIADLLLDGPLAKLTGLNLNKIGGMNNMLSILPFTDVSLDRRGVTDTGFALLAGPGGGLALKMADSFTHMEKGDALRAIESAMPNGFSSALRAVREAADGVRQGDGDTIISADEINAMETAWTGLGFQTERNVRRRYEQETKFDVGKGMTERTRRITSAYNKAVREGDADGRREAIENWSELQRTRREMGFKPQPLSDLLKGPAEQRKRDRAMEGTLQYRPTDRGFVRSVVEN